MSDGEFYTLLPDEVLEEELITLEARRKVAYNEEPDPELKNNLRALSISGGGIRSSTFSIGVIQELEKNGYVIKSISGCSMGALIGGIYAIGKLDEFEQWIRALSKCPRSL